MTPSRYLAILACAASLVACSKDAVQIISAPLSGASVKFYNFSMGAPGVNFFANDVQLTALRSDSGAATKSAARSPERAARIIVVRTISVLLPNELRDSSRGRTD